VHTTRINAQLEYPHYSNPKWKEARCLYQQDGLDKKRKPQQINYSDRLLEWDYDAHKRGCDAQKAADINRRTAENFQVYLEAYHQCKVDLLVIMGGCNVSSGYEYYVFFYDLIP
jgi:hypothetical protein